MFGKMWRAFMAQLNKLANFFGQADPVAQMQLEYDNAVEQLKEGRRGLEQYRALVERVTRQVKNAEKKSEQLTAKIKACLKTGDRTMAGKLAVDLKRTQTDLEENRQQCAMHEKSYANNVMKIKHATAKLSDVRTKIQKFDSELKMSEAEAEVAQLAQNFDFDVTTDFGQLENVIQDRIDLNHAKTRVASDLSEQGIQELQAEERIEQVMAEDMLTQFEVEMGLKTAETAGVKEEAKSIGNDGTTEPSAEEKAAALDQFEKEI